MDKISQILSPKPIPPRPPKPRAGINQFARIFISVPVEKSIDIGWGTLLKKFLESDLVRFNDAIFLPVADFGVRVVQEQAGFEYFDASGQAVQENRLLRNKELEILRGITTGREITTVNRLVNNDNFVLGRLSELLITTSSKMRIATTKHFLLEANLMLSEDKALTVLWITKANNRFDSFGDFDGDGKADLIYESLLDFLTTASTGENLPNRIYSDRLGLPSDNDIEFNQERMLSELGSIGQFYSDGFGLSRVKCFSARIGEFISNYDQEDIVKGLPSDNDIEFNQERMLSDFVNECVDIFLNGGDYNRLH